MGAWGSEPWGNDGAADWFFSLFSKYDLASEVERAFELNHEERYEEIRAAAYVLLVLGRVYIWPTDRLLTALERAVSALNSILQAGVYRDDPQTEKEIRKELSILENRLGRLRQ